MFVEWRRCFNFYSLNFKISVSSVTHSSFLHFSFPSKWAFSPYYSLSLWRRKRQPTPVFLPGKSHGQRSLVACSPRGRKESDTTDQPSAQAHSSSYNCEQGATWSYQDLRMELRCGWVKGIRSKGIQKQDIWRTVFLMLLWDLLFEASTRNISPGPPALVLLCPGHPTGLHSCTEYLIW